MLALVEIFYQIFSIPHLKFYQSYIHVINKPFKRQISLSGLIDQL